MNEMSIDQIRKYLKELTPQARGRLLVEIERLQLCGDDAAGLDLVLAELRAEFRERGVTHTRVGSPSRYFFQPLEPVLVDRTPERANSGEISRGSLATIWEWVSQDLLPTMTREYVEAAKVKIAVNDLHEVQRLAVAFQSKVIKYLENTLSSSDGEERVCSALVIFTSSRATFRDLTKVLSFLRARDALAKFGGALPPQIEAFEGRHLAKVRELLDAVRARHAEAFPFAMTMVRKRLKTPWQLIRLATKTAKTRDAADVAATPYAVAIPLVLDHLDDQRAALRTAMKNGQIAAIKSILTYIYDCEYALRVRIDRIDNSEWGRQLADVMQAVARLIESELQNFPKQVGNILQSRTLRSYDSLAGRLTYLAWKGRDVLNDSAAYCKDLIASTRKSAG
jgi:hypothetical protein